MKRLLPLLLAVTLLFSGCGWLDGSYYKVMPHQQHSAGNNSQVAVAENYLQLRKAMEDMMAAGEEKRVITVTGFREEQLNDSMDLAVRYIKTKDPIGAYAVEEIVYEVGTVGGAVAVAVDISYRFGKNEIRKILRVEDMEQVRTLIEEALTEYDPSLVILVEGYEPADIYQMVDDFAAENPSVVMETPELSLETYPDTGCGPARLPFCGPVRQQRCQRFPEALSALCISDGTV